MVLIKLPSTDHYNRRGGGINELFGIQCCPPLPNVAPSIIKKFDLPLKNPFLKIFKIVVESSLKAHSIVRSIIFDKTDK